MAELRGARESLLEIKNNVAKLVSFGWPGGITESLLPFFYTVCNAWHGKTCRGVHWNLSGQ